MGIAWVLMTASLLLAPAETADIPACGVELQVRAKASVMEVEDQQFDSWTAFHVELVNRQAGRLAGGCSAASVTATPVPSDSPK